MMKQIFLMCVASCVFFQSAMAIKCYQCKSLGDANCAKETIDESMTIYQVDCDLVQKPKLLDDIIPVTKCNKVVTKDQAGIIVSRDCHFEVIGQKPDVCLVSHSQEIQSCYTCKGDLCNASSAGGLIAMGSGLLLAIVSLIVAM